MNCYLGIDVSKGYADFILLDPEKKELEECFQLDDTSQGHALLKEQIAHFIGKHHAEAVYCGLESTGGLENNWYKCLTDMGQIMPVKAARLNPNGVKKNAEASLKRNKTDELSARYIAEYMIAQPSSIDYNRKDNHYNSFRSLLTAHQLQNKQNVQLVNQLKAVLYSVFPEMTRFCKSGMPFWLLALLKKYPTAANIACQKPERLSKIDHLTLEKAQDIIKKAKASIASRSDAADAFLVSTLAEEIEQKQMKIKKIKDFIAANCTGAEVELLKSIKGIGAFSAAAIMIEIEDIKRFPSPKQAASYFGMHPEQKQSGDKQSLPKMSKKGRPALRALLYMCAQTAVVHDPHMKEIYLRHRSNNKNHRQVIGVIMHKMLRIVWGVLNSNTPYNTETDRANQAKNTLKNLKEQGQKQQMKRRYQQPDAQAPITRKEYKKRKAHSES
jgi:transposase